MAIKYRVKETNTKLIIKSYNGHLMNWHFHEWSIVRKTDKKVGYDEREISVSFNALSIDIIWRKRYDSPDMCTMSL